MPALITSPPAPNPQPQQPSALAGPSTAAQSPAPSHEQTVAALRHFSIVGRALTGLLKNPDLGKSDIKDAMIKATTKLVADQIIPAEQAVTLLGQLPDRPFEQKQWLSQLMMINIKAQMAVLAHHQQGGNVAPDWNTASQNNTSDDHLNTMNGLMQQYGGARG